MHKEWRNKGGEGNEPETNYGQHRGTDTIGTWPGFVWSSIMAYSQWNDIAVPLNSGYRSLVCLTGVRGEGEPW